MSLDSIVKISIETQSLTMAQAGFGIPLVLGVFDHPDTWRVRSFSDTDELLKWKTELKTFPALADGLSPDAREKELKKRAEELAKANAEMEKKLRDTAVFKAATILCAQKNRVEKFKIGRIIPADNKDIAIAFSKICLEDDDFYGVLFPKEGDTYVDDAKNLASIVAQKRMILGLDVNETTKSIAIDAQEKKNDRVFCIYSSDDQMLASAWMGAMLSEAPGSASWAFRELKEVKSYGLTTEKANELEQENINRYLGIKGVGVTLDGKMAGGRFIDMTHGIDWLHVRMQERLFRLLVLNKKIPYTLKGIDLVRSEIMALLKEGIYRGLLAEDPEPQVSTPTIDQIEQSDREKRVLPKVRFNARLAGAIHKIEIQGTVTV